MQHFTKLRVWVKAHELSLAVYRVTQTFPATERYGLTAQLRRAAFSVPANIVEGVARSTDRETIRYLIIARASAAEVEYFLLLARDLRLLSTEAHSSLSTLAVETQRMLNRFLNRLRHPQPSG